VPKSFKSIGSSTLDESNKGEKFEGDELQAMANYESL